MFEKNCKINFFVAVLYFIELRLTAAHVYPSEN